MPALKSLNADSGADAAAAKRPHVCRECGKEFAAVSALFCGPTCRLSFNNRRIQRGGELYDLFMSFRYDRPAAKALKIFKLMCRMARDFRDQDQRERDGRQSWRDPKTVAERHAHLFSTVVYQPRGKR